MSCIVRIEPTGNFWIAILLLHHARYIFPFFRGSYFAYRKVDVFRTVEIAKAISSNPSYIDIGCGYGDFLDKVRQLLPNARGIEKTEAFFMHFRFQSLITLA